MVIGGTTAHELVAIMNDEGFKERYLQYKANVQKLIKKYRNAVLDGKSEDELRGILLDICANPYFEIIQCEVSEGVGQLVAIRSEDECEAEEFWAILKAFDHEIDKVRVDSFYRKLDDFKRQRICIAVCGTSVAVLTDIGDTSVPVSLPVSLDESALTHPLLTNRFAHMLHPMMRHTWLADLIEWREEWRDRRGYNKYRVFMLSVVYVINPVLTPVLNLGKRIIR